MENTTFVCRLCSQESFQQPEFVINGAARSVNDLPKLGFEGQDKVTLNLMRCRYCGHFQLPDPPVATWKYAVTAAGLSAEMRAFRLSQFREFKARFALSDGGQIWEIGTGEGLFLDLLKAAGFDPIGLEASEELVKLGKEKGRRIEIGHPQDGSLADKRIKAFVSINFLEHTTRPIEFLRRLREACEPNAVGLVEVPDFTKDLSLNRSHDLVAEHLSYFTEDTLRLTLRLAGFEVIETRSVWGGDDVAAMVRLLPKVDLTGWEKRDPAFAALKDFCENSENAPLALWGASHQALTLLAMSGRHSVVVIADSSPRKQGRQDPAWGIPIVSPKQMLELNPKTVLIMAAGYSKEVAKTLRELGFKGRVAILADGKLEEV